MTTLSALTAWVAPVLALALPLAAAPEPSGARAAKGAYDKAVAFQESTKGKVTGLVSGVRWAPDSRSAVARVEGPGGTWSWMRVDAQGRRNPAFDHARLAKRLGTLLDRTLDPQKLPLEALSFDDQGRLQFKIEKSPKAFRLAVGSEAPEACTLPEPSAPRRLEDPLPSPDGRFIASVSEHNLVVRSAKDGTVVLRSQDGTFMDAYTGAFWWSADSRRLVAMRSTQVPERKVHIVESTPADQFHPKLHTLDYAKPGDPLPREQPQLFDLEARRQVPVSGSLAPNPFEISQVRWDKDGSGFTYLYNQRGHQLLRVLRVDAATGETKVLVEETSPTFIHYSEKTYLSFLDDTRELVWMSERSGWNHLYLIDARTGAVKRQITQGEWLVRGVEWLDAATRTLVVKAGCWAPGQDPYHVHYLKVGLDGGKPLPLTEGDGFHVASFSPDHSLLLDTWSRVDQAPRTDLRRVSDGFRVATPFEADLSALRQTGWRAPERFTAKGRDGATDIWGVIWRPSTFDPSRRYPVVEYIYAGPHSSHVPKTFRAFHSPQFLAEAGFIVVQMDGMGTSNRSKAFHDVCWKNLADSGFPDRILWIKAAAARFPEMDLSRGVGIYGGSAGGQSTLRALLSHGDFYTAGVSDCGCHDNRVDKIWWNEQWMGWPIGPHYAAQSNVTDAHRLRGHLLLTLGEMDRNVDPSSTVQVVDALVKADRDFEYLVIPGHDHWMLEHPYFRRRLLDFFLRHLGSKE